MSKKSSAKTEVEIFGTVYQLRGHDDSEYLQGLAAEVDRKMREVAEQVATVDPARIAILTALNLSDELHQCRRGQDGEKDRIKEKVVDLTGQLARALEA
jgi:cell division protein ZapA